MGKHGLVVRGNELLRTCQVLIEGPFTSVIVCTRHKHALFTSQPPAQRVLRDSGTRGSTEDALNPGGNNNGKSEDGRDPLGAMECGTQRNPGTGDDHNDPQGLNDDRTQHGRGIADPDPGPDKSYVPLMS